MIHWLDVIVYLICVIIIFNSNSKSDNVYEYIAFDIVKFIGVLLFSIVYIIIFGVFDINISELLNINGEFWIGGGENKIFFKL